MTVGKNILYNILHESRLSAGNALSNKLTTQFFVKNEVLQLPRNELRKEIIPSCSYIQNVPRSEEGRKRKSIYLHMDVQPDQQHMHQEQGSLGQPGLDVLLQGKPENTGSSYQWKYSRKNK